MKKFILFFALMCTANTNAEIADAFKGVLPITDKSKMINLNGAWNLCIQGQQRKIPVPGIWEVYGVCEPKYDYPDNISGDYDTEFTIPSSWRGQQVIIRFDGVLYGYDVVLNGQTVGSWHSAYNTCLFNLTPYLTKDAFSGEPQRLKVHVYSHCKGYEFDCNDDWASHGIYRDVTLFAVPSTHLADFNVTTEVLSGNSAQMKFEFGVTEAKQDTRIEATIFSPEGDAIATFSPTFTDNSTAIKVENISTPLLWTAETPHLYTICYKLYEGTTLLQTFQQKFGIRKLTIEGNVLKLNGRAIKLRGVTCHSTDPKTVKVISEDLTLKDMRLMKEASVNYIRTSHYPREPRFYELADSLGFYIINEVPFGFGDKHLNDTSYEDILKTRAQATVMRDKSHASVLIWSVGNENPFTPMTERVGNYVHQLDSRPICYPQVGSYFRKKNYQWPEMMDIYSPHYPRTGEFAGFFAKADRPVIFTEYCHSLGISLEDHDRQWEIIQRTPCQAGGSVWEWVDQGMPFKERLADRYGYQEKVFTSEDGGFMMFGNKGTDGLLYANRIPLPNYYELRHNYAQASITDSIIEIAHSCATIPITIRNRFDFVNLKDNTSFRWTLTDVDGTVLDSGTFSPDCKPQSSVAYNIETECNNLNNTLLTVDILNKNGLNINHQSMRINPQPLKDILLKTLKKSADPMQYVQGEPYLRAGRKATMAERLKVKDQRLERYILSLENNVAKVDLRMKRQKKATRVTFSITPDTTSTNPDDNKGLFLSELGIAFLLNKDIKHVQWIGKGPYPTYPGRCQANNYGTYRMDAGDLYFEGNRMGVDAAMLTDDEGNGIMLFCEAGNVSFEETDQGIILTYNAAVAGQGPKFAQTDFPVWSKKVGTLTGEFYICSLKGFQMDNSIEKMQKSPFITQYDTYLMRFEDIKDENK